MKKFEIFTVIFLVLFQVSPYSVLSASKQESYPPDAKPCFLSKSLKSGDVDRDVLKLKIYLFSQYHVNMTADYNFDPDLVNLVKYMQKNLGIPETGELDNYTRISIFPCPTEGKLEFADTIKGLVRENWQRLQFQWHYTLKFPESVKTFQPHIYLSFKNDRIKQGCNFGFRKMKLKQGKNSLADWIERAEPNEPVNWCRVSATDGYRPSIIILPNKIDTFSKTGLTFLDYIHPDYIQQLSTTSEKTFTIDPVEAEVSAAN